MGISERVYGRVGGEVGRRQTDEQKKKGEKFSIVICVCFYFSIVGWMRVR